MNTTFIEDATYYSFYHKTGTGYATYFSLLHKYSDVGETTWVWEVLHLMEWLNFAGRYWFSGLLIIGVLVAIWYVAGHRDKLMFDKATPPKK